MRFLLDTDTCIFALKHHTIVLENLLSQRREDVAVSVISEAELRTGAAKKPAPTKMLHLVENFLRPLTILDYTSADATTYAQIRAKLERAGTPVGPFDTLIAGQALGRKLTLVTNNQQEFRKVLGLRLENWTRSMTR